MDGAGADAAAARQTRDLTLGARLGAGWGLADCDAMFTAMYDRSAEVYREALRHDNVGGIAAGIERFVRGAKPLAPSALGAPRALAADWD